MVSLTLRNCQEITFNPAHYLKVVCLQFLIFLSFTITIIGDWAQIVKFSVWEKWTGGYEQGMNRNIDAGKHR